MSVRKDANNGCVCIRCFCVAVVGGDGQQLRIRGRYQLVSSMSGEPCGWTGNGFTRARCTGGRVGDTLALVCSWGRCFRFACTDTVGRAGSDVCGDFVSGRDLHTSFVRALTTPAATPILIHVTYSEFSTVALNSTFARGCIPPRSPRTPAHSRNHLCSLGLEETTGNYLGARSLTNGIYSHPRANGSVSSCFSWTFRAHS
jgi:hypothetical protein